MPPKKGKNINNNNNNKKKACVIIPSLIGVNLKSEEQNWVSFNGVYHFTRLKRFDSYKI
jgi:hypothetical protein